MWVLLGKQVIRKKESERVKKIKANYQDEIFEVMTDKNLPEIVKIRKIKRIVRSYTINTNLREKIFKRDNYCCVICGSKKDTELHHIDYNLEEDRMVTLCHKCHRKIPYMFCKNYEIKAQNSKIYIHKD